MNLPTVPNDKAQHVIYGVAAGLVGAFAARGLLGAGRALVILDAAIVESERP